MANNTDVVHIETTEENQESGVDLPESIGTYTILEKIGDGGFATVYLARPTEPTESPQSDELDQVDEEAPPVALKVLSTPENYGRFRREIDTIASLEHPNIIHIFDSGEGRPNCGLAGVCLQGS